MNKKQCKDAAQYIRPSEDFAQRTMAYLKRESDKAHRCTRHMRLAAATVLAVAVCAAIVLFAFPELLQTPEAPSGSVAVSSTTAMASASASTETQRLVLDGSPIPYSSLSFGYTETINYPDIPDQTEQMCVIAFSEEMLSRSALVARVTVTDVCFNNYFDHTYTALYTLRIERIFYTSLDVAEGDSFTVEQILYGGTLSDTEFGLQPGGRYILPICADEGIVTEYDIDNAPHSAPKQSAYSLLYPFQPMIQLTADGGYLFFAQRDTDGIGLGWQSLISEETVEVVMDVETVSGTDSWIENMKLRVGTGFEDDFQILVNQYCGK